MIRFIYITRIGNLEEDVWEHLDQLTMGLVDREAKIAGLLRHGIRAHLFHRYYINSEELTKLMNEFTKGAEPQW